MYMPKEAGFQIPLSGYSRIIPRWAATTALAWFASRNGLRGRTPRPGRSPARSAIRIRMDFDSNVSRTSIILARAWRTALEIASFPILDRCSRKAGVICRGSPSITNRNRSTLPALQNRRRNCDAADLQHGTPNGLALGARWRQARPVGAGRFRRHLLSARLPDLGVDCDGCAGYPVPRGAQTHRVEAAGWRPPAAPAMNYPESAPASSSTTHSSVGKKAADLRAPSV